MAGVNNRTRPPRPLRPNRRPTPNLLITGTPGTGKSTTASALAEATNLRYICIGDLIKEKNLHDGWDDEFKCHIINEDLVGLQFNSSHSSGETMLVKTLLPRHLLVSRCFSSVASKTLLKVGDALRETRVFSSEDVKAYAEVSHDWNPLHFDPESARKAGFENRLVHGMLVSSMFPRIISAHFPGAVYVSQTLHFRSPVYIGDEILGLVQATALRETKNKYIVKFSTKCFKNNNELVVLDGEATAMLPNLEMLQSPSE